MAEFYDHGLLCLPDPHMELALKADLKKGRSKHKWLVLATLGG